MKKTEMTELVLAAKKSERDCRALAGDLESCTQRGTLQKNLLICCCWQVLRTEGDVAGH
jgi:hypothetical protein